MSFANALKNYNSLTDQQKEFVSSRTIRADLTPEAWISFLKGIIAVNRESSGLRRTLGLTALFGLLLGLIIPLATGIPLLFILLLPGIIALVLYMKLRSTELPPSLREFILPVIMLLREDMEPDRLLHLELDLSGGTKSTKKKTENRFEKNGRKISDTFYLDPWMVGESQLADGTQLRWRVQDAIRDRRITKRSASGKTKVKGKQKVKRSFDVRVGLRGDSYALTSGDGGTAPGTTSVQQGEKRNVIRTRKVVVNSSTSTVPKVDDLFRPIMAAYQRVSLKGKEA